MREILFRGKRTDNGEWIEGFYGKSGDKTFIILDNDIAIGYFKMREVFPETVGQFTELVTANETPIFEGDIVRFDDANYEVRRECDTPGGYWAETGFILKRIGWSQMVSFTDTIDDFCNEICVEIIGNIHDNPELLEK